jgi:Phosphate-selective porin O and P
MTGPRLRAAVLAASLLSATQAETQALPAEPPAETAPGTAPTPTPTPTPGPATESDPAPEADALVFSWKSRVMTGFELTRERPSGDQIGESVTDYGFFLDQARLELEAAYGRLSSEVSVDLADAIRPGYGEGLNSPPFLRDAFLNVRIKKAFRLRAGRFKRPYSRLELISSGVLPFRGRGLTNELIVEEGEFGGRALGLMAWGKLPAGFNWYVGASNPDWAHDGDQEANGVDALARLVWEPNEGLSVGVNGGHKLTVQAGQHMNTNAAGLDAELRKGRLWIVFDALLAELPTAMPERESALAYGAVLSGSYAFEPSPAWSLAPVLLGEYADADGDYSGSEAVRAIAGLNVVVLDGHLRVMPQVEIVRPLGTASAQNPWLSSEAYYVMLVAQL